MQVVDHLAAAPSDIYGKAVTLCGDGPLRGKLLGRGKEFSEQRNMPVFHIIYRGNVLLGHQEDVDRRFRIDIFEDNQVVIFMHNLSGSVPGDDLAKDAQHDW